MLIYLAVASFFFLLALAERKLQTQQGLAIWCFCFLLLVLFDGLRWENGTDWDSYFYYFRDCLVGSSSLDSLFEPGFVFVNQAVRSVTENYTVFLVILAVFVFVGYFSFIRSYSPLPFLSLFLLYVTILPVQGMNRQMIAIIICLFSVRFLLSRQYGYFILCVLFALLFHSTAFLFLFALFLNREFKYKTYIIILAVGSLICLSGAMSAISNLSISMLGGALGERVAVYFSGNAYESSFVSKVIGLAMRALFIIPFLFAMRRGTKIPKKYVFFFNMYLIGTLFYMFFTGTIFQIMVSRGALYFNIFQIIIIPCIVMLYRKSFSRAGMLAFLYVYCLFTLTRSIHYYDFGDYNSFLPYKSLVINTDVQKFMY